MPYYYRSAGGFPQWCQVYLRYQDQLPHCNTTLEVDNSALAETGFTCCYTYPEKFTGDTLTLTSTDSHCIKVYSDSLTNHFLVVSFGQSVGKDWIHVIPEDFSSHLHWTHITARVNTMKCWLVRQSIYKPWIRCVMALNAMVRSALCRSISLKEPWSFRFWPLCGRTQGCVELSLRCFTTPVSVTYQMNGECLMLTWVVFLHVPLTLISGLETHPEKKWCRV